MPRKKVYYISYYDSELNADQKRGYTLACTNKMDYIIEALENAGNEVEVISASLSNSLSYQCGKTYPLSRHSSVKLFPSFGRTKIGRAIDLWIVRRYMRHWLNRRLKSGDQVILYHSLGYAKDMLGLFKKSKARLILELEEIYSDVYEDKSGRPVEDALIDVADAYIFPTQMLDDQYNRGKKPYVLIHGTYKVEPQVVEKFDDGKIHVVYAGTFDPRKGGAAAAAAAAAQLPENYHVHICGFGSDKEVENLKKVITESSAKGRATVTYDGLKKGREYIEFLQKCHIGMSTQIPDGEYNGTSFPSKVLSYMANGLDVVSIDIPAIRNSAVGPYLHFYTEQTPQAIAQAIMDVKIGEYNPREVISRLSDKFTADIKEMLENNHVTD